MRSTLVSAHALLVSGLLVFVGVPWWGGDDGAAFSLSGPARASGIGEPAAMTQGPGCPDPILVCSIAHPGSVVTGYCTGGACFEMNHGEEVRVVAADERGDYPDTWFAWHDGTMAGSGPRPCILTEHENRIRNKTRLEMPGVRCRAQLQTGQHLYYEHFMSDPSAPCLGWLECRAY